jgi:ABC-type multidrug transport system fused ATPase/permease subunit
MFEAIMRREIAFFDDEANSIGTITTRLADDSRIANKAFGEALAKQFQAFFTLAVGVGIGFSACWQISFVVLATLPINIMASAIQMQAIAGQQYEADEPDTQVKANVPQKSPKSADGKTPQIMEGKGRGKGKVAKGELVESSVIGTSPVAMISTVFTNMRTVSAFSMQRKVLSHYTSVTQDKSTKRCEKSTMAGSKGNTHTHIPHTRTHPIIIIPL